MDGIVVAIRRSEPTGPMEIRSGFSTKKIAQGMSGSSCPPTDLETKPIPYDISDGRKG